MIDGITIFDSLYPFEAIFKSVLLWHNNTPKVFCLTFGVHVKKGIPQFFSPVLPQRPRTPPLSPSFPASFPVIPGLTGNLFMRAMTIGCKTPS